MPFRSLTQLFILSFFVVTTVAAPAHADLTLIPRLGVVVYGQGDLRFDCQDGGVFASSDAACIGTDGRPCVDGGETEDPDPSSMTSNPSPMKLIGVCETTPEGGETADTSGLVLGLDLALEATEGFRVGIGGLYLTENSIEASVLAGKKLETLGADLSVYGFAEFGIPLGDRYHLWLRGFAGGFVFFPMGNFGARLDDFQTRCDELMDSTCDIDRGPYVGWTAGGGAGVSFDLDGYAFRTDLVGQYYDLPFVEFNVDAPAGELASGLDLTAFRAMLLLGLELNLSGS